MNRPELQFFQTMHRARRGYDPLGENGFQRRHTYQLRQASPETPYLSLQPYFYLPHHDIFVLGGTVELQQCSPRRVHFPDRIHHLHTIASIDSTSTANRIFTFTTACLV